MGMFNLEPSQLKGLKILDCPSGASSFGAEAYNEYGIKKVVGCDVLYDNDGQENALTTAVEKRGLDLSLLVIDRLSQVPDLYSWNLYADIDVLWKSRAIIKLISDYAKGIKENRYIKAQLPNLPFDDKSYAKKDFSQY